MTKAKKMRRQKITQRRHTVLMTDGEYEPFQFTNEVQRAVWTEVVFHYSSLSKWCFLSLHWNLVAVNLAYFFTQTQKSSYFMSE